MNRDHTFNRRLAAEVARNKDSIADILLDASKVGQCGGKCRGYGEQSLDNLCDQCRGALEANADAVFYVSEMMRLLGGVMDSRG